MIFEPCFSVCPKLMPFAVTTRSATIIGDRPTCRDHAEAEIDGDVARGQTAVGTSDANCAEASLLRQGTIHESVWLLGYWSMFLRQHTRLPLGFLLKMISRYGNKSGGWTAPFWRSRLFWGQSFFSKSVVFRLNSTTGISSPQIYSEDELTQYVYIFTYIQMYIESFVHVNIYICI